MKKELFVALAATAMLASGVASAQPMQGDHGQWNQDRRDGQNSRGCYPGERYGDCSQRRSVERRRHHHYVWRDGRYMDQDDSAGTAFLGFVLGAAIAGSNSDRDYYNSHRNDRGWRSRCRDAYDGFDYRTGTYIGPDGYRHYCTR
jgi:hypothetical protein